METAFPAWQQLPHTEHKKTPASAFWGKYFALYLKKWKFNIKKRLQWGTEIPCRNSEYYNPSNQIQSNMFDTNQWRQNITWSNHWFSFYYESSSWIKSKTHRWRWETCRRAGSLSPAGSWGSWDTEAVWRRPRGRSSTPTPPWCPPGWERIRRLACIFHTNVGRSSSSYNVVFSVIVGDVLPQGPDDDHAENTWGAAAEEETVRRSGRLENYTPSQELCFIFCILLLWRLGSQIQHCWKVCSLKWWEPHQRGRTRPPRSWRWRTSGSGRRSWSGTCPSETPTSPHSPAHTTCHQRHQRHFARFSNSENNLFPAKTGWAAKSWRYRRTGKKKGWFYPRKMIWFS